MLEVELLGPPDVRLDGSAISVDTRKAVALLAYLVVEGSATRETLAALLWSESDPQRARGTLRRTLSVLRAAVGTDVIDVDRHRVAVIARSASVDVWRFEDRLRTPSHHQHDDTDGCAACLPDLRAAAELYRGDFLAGFAIRGAPDFEDWARAVGESLRSRAGEALRRLARAYAAIGDYQAAIRAAGRWLAFDPLHEPAYRELMLLHVWAGDRAGAIDAYRRCVASLDQELGVSPLQETSQLYRSILDEEAPPAPSRGDRSTPQVTAAPAALESRRLVGRDEELAWLRACAASVVDRGRVVELTGGPWMGKTRLLEEFVASLPSERTAAAVGRASRGEQRLPYGVAVQVLRGLAPRIAATDDLPDWVLREVGRLVPELARADGGAARSDRFGELRFLDAVATLLGGLARERDLVLAVDDAQWLDAASASLLSYVGRRIGAHPILLLLAHGADEGGGDPLAELSAMAEAVVELQPLTVEQVAPAAGDTQEATAIMAATGGIPLLVAERLAGGHASAGGTPGVMSFLESRVRDLSELARQVLGAAAVLDGACHATLLRDVSGRGEEEVVHAVEELIAAGLLHESPTSDELRFTLGPLAQVIYDSMSLIRRRLLHRRAAAALATRPRAETDPQTAAAVAAHHQGAGAPEAAEWYRRAGDLASDLYAYTEAGDLYDHAIALGIADLGGVRLRRGRVAMAIGDYGAALHHLNAAAAHHDAEELGVVEHLLGEVQRLLGRFDLAEEHFARASQSHPSPALLYADWALLRYRTGDRASAQKLAQRSLDLAEEADDDGQRSRAHNTLGVVASADDLAQRSLDLALRLAGDNELLKLAALNNRAHLATREGDLEAAVLMVEQAIALAERTGFRHREAALRNHLADLHHLAGRDEEAEEIMVSAVTLFAGVGAGDLEPEVWLLDQW